LKRNAHFSAGELARCGIFSALMAICSWISIPTAVPFSMQTFAVFLCAGVLSARKSALAIGVYILLGMAGVPVFSGFAGGPGVILGQTGGYIVGFIPCAAVSALLIKRARGNFVLTALSMAAGLCVLYAFGTAWFVLAYAKETGAAGVMGVMSWCVFPFIVPDVVKICMAAALCGRMKKIGREKR